MGDLGHSKEVASALRDTEAFLNRRLLSDLEKAHAQRRLAEEQLGRYTELAEGVRALEVQGATTFRTHTELGAGVLVEAEVPDASRVFVDVGLGFHVELRWAEALQVAAQRKSLAQEQLRVTEQAVAKVQSAIWLAQQGLLGLRQGLS
ncbi:hypothetical protein WJX81_008113 [Elliptochloris bilobata]|uniref:Uncharacterized protein n=1 Tax=Elliptochloris bilobata TaxID=381761 RepID=A0AAW1SF74_9CHLO